MTLQNKVGLAVLAGIGLLVLFFFVSDEVEERVAPRAIRALVAIETETDGVARTGWTEVEPGTPFTLHGVVEAVDWKGDTVYYTEASRLMIEGQPIPQENLRRWDRGVETRVLWFTVEGFKPYLEVSDAGELGEFHYRENLRPSWPRSWSIPGSLKGSGDAALRQAELGDVARFGTQRYHVRIEVFGPQSRITPRERIQSLAADTLPDSANDFATVVAARPGRLRVPTSLFGVPQIELEPQADAEIRKSAQRWIEPGLLFTRGSALKSFLSDVDTSFDRLDWSDLDMAERVVWGSSGVEEGDLLRVGERWVVLLEDRGVPGRIDRDDLCLDYDRGPRVSRIGEVFTGDGLVEWAATRESDK